MIMVELKTKKYKTKKEKDLTMEELMATTQTMVGNEFHDGGSFFQSVRVYPLTLFCTPKSMWHDSRASFLTCNLASPCLSCEPKVKVVTTMVELKTKKYKTKKEKDVTMEELMATA